MNGCEREVIIFVYTHLILDCYILIDWNLLLPFFFFQLRCNQSANHDTRKKGTQLFWWRFLLHVISFDYGNFARRDVESNGPSTWRTINYHRQSIEMTCVDHIGSSRRPLTLLANNIFFKKLKTKKGNKFDDPFACVLLRFNRIQLPWRGNEHGQFDRLHF